MAKSTLYNIYADLVHAVTPIVGERYVFLKDRPNVKRTDTPMPRFVVIDLSARISDTVIGDSKTMLQTSGVLYAFVESRSNNTLDVNATGDLVDKLFDLFPISGEYVVAKNPQVLMRGSDGEGFQVTTITFDLYTRWRAFDKKT